MKKVKINTSHKISTCYGRQVASDHNQDTNPVRGIPPWANSLGVQRISMSLQTENQNGPNQIDDHAHTLGVIVNLIG